jgi:hypothetical protein
VSVSDYLSDERFCSDVSETIEENFDQRDFMGLLLEDFLFQARKR